MLWNLEKKARKFGYRGVLQERLVSAESSSPGPSCSTVPTQLRRVRADPVDLWCEPESEMASERTIKRETERDRRAISMVL